MSEEAPEAGEPTPEEIAQMMYERLAAAPVPSVLAQTMATFADLAAIRIGLGPEGDEQAHPGEARLAIDILTALLPIAEAAFGPQASEFKQAVSELQMAFVQKVQAEGGPAPAPSEGSAPPQPQPQKPPIIAPTQPPGESGLWVPPHHRT
jgi:hypothetical protein